TPRPGGLPADSVLLTRWNCLPRPAQFSLSRPDDPSGSSFALPHLSPTVSLDIIALVARSGGYKRRHGAPHAAPSCTGARGAPASMHPPSTTSPSPMRAAHGTQAGASLQ